MMQPSLIFIIGDAFDGLAFAQSLKKHGISFHVYEHDTVDGFHGPRLPDSYRWPMSTPWTIFSMNGYRASTI